MRPIFALWSDETGLTHVGPDSTHWSTYTVCGTRRTKGLFRVVGKNRVATCLQCIANVDRDGTPR